MAANVKIFVMCVCVCGQIDRWTDLDVEYINNPWEANYVSKTCNRSQTDSVM